MYKRAGERAECSQRQREGRGLRVPLREKTRTEDETDGPLADQQALYYINIKPSPCPYCTVPTHTYARANRLTHSQCEGGFFFFLSSAPSVLWVERM